MRSRVWICWRIELDRYSKGMSRGMRLKLGRSGTRGWAQMARSRECAALAVSVIDVSSRACPTQAMLAEVTMASRARSSAPVFSPRSQLRSMEGMFHRRDEEESYRRFYNEGNEGTEVEENRRW